ncbi:MAG: hypothetical protein FJ278_06205, partial [Planctomycetes bacterium]|nr:hypothetical protein [Planctomycetota bacterium]
MIRPITIAAVILLSAALYAADDLLLADFEGDTYGAWQATGEAFGKGPARGTLPRQAAVTGFLGEGLVNTYLEGDGATGTLTSPEFKVERKFINFLIGGGAHQDETCVVLLVDGKIVRSATGRNTEPLDWATWDVSKLIGKAARIRIVDENRAGWGHVNVDHIVQSDTAKAKTVVDSYEGDVLIADFETETWGDWQATGDSFGAGPWLGQSRRDRPGTWRGERAAHSGAKGAKPTGTLTSPEFAIERKFINLLIGGGNWPGLTCVNLLVDGQVVRTSAGTDDDTLTWVTWDVTDINGKTARIQFVDGHSGLFGHVMVDQIVHSNRPRSPEIVGDREPGRQMARAAMEKFGVQDIIFATRQEEPDGHWYANFSYWSSSPTRRMYHDGGSLRRLNLKTGEVTKLIDEPTGGVRDPQLHYDGKRILFSYRKGGQPFYHLYEMNVDGTGLRQITDGPFDDIEPSYLPDGGIVFCSTRCNRMVNCYYVRVAIVHRCDADGSNIRPLSCNIEQDNTPWPLPDG